MSQVPPSRKKPSLSPIIRWALGASLLACVWALWMPRREPIVDASTRVDEAPQWTSRAVASRAPSEAADAGSLPQQLPEVVYSPHQRDIFEAMPAAGLPTSAPQRLPDPIQVPSPVAAALAPEPLVVPFQFLGRMSAPDGAVLTFLAMHDEVIPVKQGDALPEGFKVADINQHQITLHHVATGQQVVIDLSPVQ
jgi:hypothetical protein